MKVCWCCVILYVGHVQFGFSGKDELAMDDGLADRRTTGELSC